MTASGSEYYIELSDDPIRFEPVCKFTSVFFDDANKQVFAVRSGGATGVSVKGPNEKSCMNFRMEDKGSVISIKFSPDLKVLAIQRTERSVEFINVLPSMDSIEYSQSCKDHGIEYYQVIAEKRLLKIIKSYSITINWLVYMSEASVLLLSSGTLGNILHPYQFKTGVVYKMAKFEVDLPIIPKPPRLSLLERDVTMANIYGQVYIIILRQQPRLSNQSQSGTAAAAASASHSSAEVVLYQLQKESPARKTDVLKLAMSGRFAMNVVDNLLVLHHQPTKTSLVYDIKHECSYTDGFVNYHRPLLSPLPIKPAQLKLPQMTSQLTGEPSVVTCDMYSPNWVVFQPNIIIDAKLGCLWYVTLNLSPTRNMFTDKLQLVDFLLRRRCSQMALLNACRDLILPIPRSRSGSTTGDLAQIAQLFDNINSVYQSQLESEQRALLSGMSELGAGSGPPAISGPSALVSVSSVLSNKLPAGEAQANTIYRSSLTQSDIYTHLLCPLVEEKHTGYKFTLAIIVEYLRSLNQHQIPVQHYLYELLINTLVQNNCCYQLHQFIQYHVLSDSKPLACSLLALQTIYPPAHQLALDMLKRLYTANDDMVEVLLSKQQLLSALRFIRSVGIVDNVSSRKFLEAAANTGDSMLFYTVYKFFEQRNLRLRGSPTFKEGEQCDEFVSHFCELFGKDALANTSAAGASTSTATITNQAV